jgi:hypothetical protein
LEISNPIKFLRYCSTVRLPPSFGHCRIQWLDPKADVRLADGFVPEAVPDAPLRHPNECL